MIKARICVKAACLGSDVFKEVKIRDHQSLLRLRHSPPLSDPHGRIDRRQHIAATLDMKAFDMSCKWSISVADDLLTSQLQVLHNTFSLLQALCKAEVMVRKINDSREIATRKPTKDHIDCFQGFQACVAASYRPHW